MIYLIILLELVDVIKAIVILIALTIINIQENRVLIIPKLENRIIPTRLDLMQL